MVRRVDDPDEENGDDERQRRVYGGPPEPPRRRVGGAGGEDFEEYVRDLLRGGRWQSLLRRGAGLWIVLVILIIGGWLATGFYQVGPGEQGVVRQFGKLSGQTDPGLRYHLPWPIERVDKVNLALIQRLELGFRSGGGDRAQRVPEEALMLTGDQNIVEAQMIVQYRIRDAARYLFLVREPEAVLKDAAEVALRSIAGSTTIDDLLTIGRGEAEEKTLIFMQLQLDDYQAGLLVQNVKLQVVDAPEQVRDAFHDVVRALEDRERLINEARGYAEDVIPKARGEGQRMVFEAEGYKQERIIRAQGDVAKFVQVLEEYEKAPEVTRARLYLETMNQVLPNVEKVITDGAFGDNILPFLPLRDGATSAQGAAAAAAAGVP
ncbi:MAG: FtsH protease activity modulator HflK [Dehalococcoidia bacterium]|nr:FtsH protease activity modulator HflK [Dehalococcoidia bacterium]